MTDSVSVSALIGAPDVIPLLDVVLANIIVEIEVAGRVLVLVTILEDVADISSVLNAVLVDVTDGEDVNSLLNVTLVMTEDKGDIALLVPAPADVTDVGNADDSSLLDDVLVGVTILIEATDSAVLVAIAHVISGLDTALSALVEVVDDTDFS